MKLQPVLRSKLKNIFTSFLYVGLKLEGVWEQGTEENIWTKEKVTRKWRKFHRP
jgi:hypothetical protein